MVSGKIRFKTISRVVFTQKSVLLIINVHVKGYKAVSLTEIDHHKWGSLYWFTLTVCLVSAKHHTVDG
uniref:Uncharacterized protein n=1 Tax=Arion vulgaris TaxID=1028688 RepID=A0A0B6Y9G3_9EUPU